MPIKARSANGRFLSGDEQMLKNLRKIAHKVPSVAAAALYMEGERVMRRSKQEFVPVSHPGGGALKRSGLVDPPVRGSQAPPEANAGPFDWVVRLSYGGEASAYAQAVHEHLSEHSPPTWVIAESRGGVKFRLPGTGPKYLEKPLNDAKRGLDERIAEKVRLVFQGGA